MIPDRWEHGSDVEWMPPTGRATYPWHSHSLFGCGRFALAAVLAQLGCRRLWVPSFYCPEVITALPRDRIAIAVYPDLPTEPLAPLVSLPHELGDVILTQNLYGLRSDPPSTPVGVPVVEDHTHDLASGWAVASRADYGFASLRKLLPVADGGVVWSPTGRPLPPEPPLDVAHEHAALDRLTGLILKAAYLDGGAIDKTVYRGHCVAGEGALAGGPCSGILPLTRASLPGYPVHAWRARRALNFAAFAEALGGTALLLPAAGAVPFVATLCFDTAQTRDRVRERLIAERVYPAVLWPLDHADYGPSDEARALSRRLLSLHCDQRYDASDMQRVAALVQRALD